MPTPREPKSPALFAVRCRQDTAESVSETVHPGWVRATAILLRGLARLTEQEPPSAN
jgi:hypothetical protein